MFSLFLGGLCLGLTIVNGSPTENFQQSSTLVNRIDRFSNKFYETFLREEKDQSYQKREAITSNNVMSPLSAYIPLFILCRGAKGQTQYFLNRILQTHCQGFGMGLQYGNLFTQLNNVRSPDANLKLASGIFISDQCPLKPSYVELEKSLSTISDFEQIDFSKHDSAAGKMNQWIEGKTDHYLSNVIEEDSIKNETVMVIINTLYFKAMWADPFDEILTRNEVFTDSQGREKMVPFMRRLGHYRAYYHEELGAEFIEMPFAGREFSFVIFLPLPGENLLNVEEKLSKLDMTTLFETTNGLTVDSKYIGGKEFLQLHMPKFSITSSIHLIPLLQKMGWEDIANEDLNLSKMTDYKLKVSSMEQKVKIEVNENGVVAAAATPNNFALRSGPITIKVNRPFAFVIRHHPSESNLFFGNVRSL